MTRTWSLPDNTHGFVRKETREWIMVRPCDECPDGTSIECHGGTGKGHSDSCLIGAVQTLYVREGVMLNLDLKDEEMASRTGR